VNHSDREKAFAEKIRGIRDADVDRLDPEERARFYRDRLMELDAGIPRQSRRHGRRHATWGAAFLAAAVMLGVAGNLVLRPKTAPPIPPGLMADSDILIGTDSLDVYENLEFYRWLAEATATAE